MEEKFFGFIESMLDRIFSGIMPQTFLLNAMLGLVFLFFGVDLLRKRKSKNSKNIGVIGWACVAIGSLGTVSGIVQFVKTSL